MCCDLSIKLLIDKHNFKTYTNLTGYFKVIEIPKNATINVSVHKLIYTQKPSMLRKYYCHNLKYIFIIRIQNNILT